jgi:archaellum component FlaC
MEQLPKVLAEKLRLKYTHEHLDPGLLAIFGGWDNFMRMMKEVEKGNFSSVLDAMAAKSKEFAQSAGLMNQRIDNLKKTMGQGFEPLVGPFREFISGSVKEMQEAIEKNLPQIKGYFRGLNQGIKEALGINPLDSWIKSFNDLFSEQSGLSMFMKGETKGKEIGAAIKPWVDAFKKLGSSLDSVAASFQRFKATFKDVIDLVAGEGKAIERIQNFALSGAQQLGQEFKPYGYLKDQMYRWMPKEGETDEQYRARVIEQRKQDAAGVSASQSLHNLSPVDLIRYIGEQLGLLKEKQPPQSQMPSNIGLSGTLRIEGNTATINASGKPNTANAMGK